VVVTDNTAIAFDEDYMTMTQNETVTVKVQSPANRVIRYSSSDKNVVEADGTNTMCILRAKKEGTAIISAYDVGGTKSDHIIVKVNAQTFGRPYINARTFVLLSRQQPQGTSIKAKLLKAGDDAEITAAYNQNLYWTVDNGGRVTLAGGHKHPSYPGEYKNYIFGDEIGIQPGNVGDAVITVRYYHNNPKDESYEKYPELKNAELKIYVRVNSSGTSVVIDPSVFTLDWGQNEGRIVTAKVTGESGVDYEKDIRWVSDDENIAKVIPHGFNSHESVAQVVPYSTLENPYEEVKKAKSGPVVIRAYYEKDGVQADYGTATAVVTPRRMLGTSMGSVLVNPDSGVTFTNIINDKNYDIYCYPEDEQLLITASNNAYFTYTYEEKFEKNEDTGIMEAKRSLVISGTPVEGAGNIIITGKTYGLTAQILVTNSKNQNIFWKDGDVIRLEPGETEKKLYLLMPPHYKLELAVQTEFGITLGGKNSMGQEETNPVLKLTDTADTGSDLFNKCLTVQSTGKSGSYTVHFDVKDNGKGVEAIPRQTIYVYVGYKNITIDFKATNVVNPGALLGDLPSRYDETQSSIRLVGNRMDGPEYYGLKLALTAKSGDRTDKNVVIDRVVFEKNENLGTRLFLGKDGNANEITLYYKEHEVHQSSAALRGNLYKVNFVGVLTVYYQYYGYNGKVENQKRNFLLYHDQYYW
jgi:hypothetical protein